MTNPANELDELLAQLRAATAEAVAEMAGAQQEFAQQYAEQRAEREAVQERQAERARAGELGPELRRVQESIDRGETSMQAVIDGSDDSAEAAAVRGNLVQNATAFAQALDQELEAQRVSGVPDPRDQVRATIAELSATVATLAAQEQENRRGQ